MTTKLKTHLLLRWKQTEQHRLSNIIWLTESRSAQIESIFRIARTLSSTVCTKSLVAWPHLLNRIPFCRNHKQFSAVKTQIADLVPAFFFFFSFAKLQTHFHKNTVALVMHNGKHRLRGLSAITSQVSRLKRDGSELFTLFAGDEIKTKPGDGSNWEETMTKTIRGEEEKGEEEWVLMKSEPP